MSGWISAHGPYFCPACSHFQVITQPCKSATNCENLMPTKVPTCLHFELNDVVWRDKEMLHL